jgi:hypothetical protein
MQVYAVFINEQALAAAPHSGTQRESVMKFVRSLAGNPNIAGDFTEKDNGGRIVQVKVVGRYAVTFWADHAVSEIKVTHIRAIP